MSRDITPFGVRMPAELKALVDEAAVASGRSINAEVVARLFKSFGDINNLSATSTGALLDELILRLGDRVQIVISRGAQDA